jgi:hypothetical protein
MGGMIYGLLPRLPPKRESSEEAIDHSLHQMEETAGISPAAVDPSIQHLVVK